MTVCFGVKCPGCGQRNCPNPQIGEYFDGVDERPVAPAPTASAREWRLRELPHTKNQVITSIAPCDLDDILEAYASSQSSKLEAQSAEVERLSKLVEDCPGCKRKRIADEYCFGCAFDAAQKACEAAESKLSQLQLLLEEKNEALLAILNGGQQ